MSKSTRVAVAVVCALGVALVATALALFHGYFDHGQFVVKETNWSSSRRVAIVAERSDDEAMNGDQYFVLIGDHVFSPSELRAAYYGHRVIFATDSDCLGVRWRDPNNLTVLCRKGFIDKSHIELQIRQAGDVTITYETIQDANPARK